ncbi:ferric-chelate reductase 1-like isoform X2 [Ptychodera flava]|uniref:ferric-chelate reductase 1-like isoform X2 n=1 Tax=Ptychodera flava TaxID=63121 RepID=UPI00396A96BC
MSSLRVLLYSQDKIRFTRTLTLLAILFSIKVKAGALVTSDGCGHTKGCFQNPMDCDSSANTCDVLITWARNGNATSFGIMGQVQGQQDYMAIGFSHDKHMGDDDVWACLRLADGSITLDHSNNVDHSNMQLESTIGTGNFESTAIDGTIQCTFSRLNKMQGYESTFFDLAAKEYFLLLARGQRSNSAPKLSIHDKLPIVSHDPINFADISSSHGSSKTSAAYKAHGILMLIGWIGCASVAIVLARYFKRMWPTKSIFGLQIWFTFHRGLMVANVCCFSVSFVVIFASVSGWVPYNTTNDVIFVHAIIGCVIVALGMLNPIMAFFRPKLNSKDRFVFNWSHWAIGTSSHLLAVVNVFLGMDTLSMPSYSLWIFAVWLLLHFAFQIFMEVLNCVYVKSDAYMSYRLYSLLKSYVNLQDDTGTERGGSCAMQPVQQEKLEPVSESAGTQRPSPGDDTNGDDEFDGITPRQPMAQVRFYALCSYIIITVGILVYLIIEVILK